MRQPAIDGILIKKKFGQHFLKDQFILDTIVENVALTPQTNVFEIGGGSGVLTRTILGRQCARLWVFEIDQEWAAYLQETIHDQRLTVHHENILDTDFAKFAPFGKWTILSNLPYNVTFPIFHKLVENRHLLQEGVVMIQEEVAQKLVKKGGRDYGFVSLYFQYYFELKLLTKIPPSAFYPAPKVDSRLVYLRPKEQLQVIPHEEQFWKFIKLCFHQPRRTLANNLKTTHYQLDRLDQKTLSLRAQQMSFQDLIEAWESLMGAR